MALNSETKTLRKTGDSSSEEGYKNTIDNLVYRSMIDNDLYYLHRQ